MNTEPSFFQSNTLKFSTSPYLLEHAENPVHWHEWNDETLAYAKAVDRPLIISIGYAACHWCHVMADISFSDRGVAEVMNTHFVCIKVDREERPDLDAIYMNACQIVSGSGGWPLNAFAFPDGRPFFAGTYFPKNQWIQLLTNVRNLYKNDREKLEQQADQITNGIKGYEVITLKGQPQQFENGLLESVLQVFQRNFDKMHGGQKGAPKFPLPVGWSYLLDYYTQSKNSSALEMVELTLKKMAYGGINDQIGGGFARYSVDAQWLVPHFEKMLYDNAQLISLYSKAFMLTGNGFYGKVVEETIAFSKRELLNETGGFYSSLNADSEKVEGKFYVWSYEEVSSILTEAELLAISDYYNISEEGNWEEGKNILHLTEDVDVVAQRYSLSVKEFEKMVSAAKQKLLLHRSNRIRPETDTKILTSWNALMAKALLDAYSAFGNQEYLDLALQNLDFLLVKMLQSDGILYRNFSAGKAAINGFLDDYAFFAEALLTAYQATFRKLYLDKAIGLIEYCLHYFKSSSGSLFYYTSSASPDLVVRKMEISDNVIPASNSVMANVLYQAGRLSSREEWVDLAKEMVSLVPKQVESGGPYYANWASLIVHLQSAQREVVITGEGWEEALKPLLKLPLTGTVFAGGSEENLPMIQGRVEASKLQIFICKNHVCNMPVYSVEEAVKLLRSYN